MGEARRRRVGWWTGRPAGLATNGKGGVGMKIEFKHKGLPQTDTELRESLEEIRSAVSLGGEATEEALAKVTADVRSAMESVEAAKRAEQVAKDALEIAKAAQVAGRTSEDRVERQLKALPMTYSVAKDEDWGQRNVTPGHFNVMQMDDAELRIALGDEAYQAAKRLRKLNDTLLTAHIVLSGQSQGSRRAYEERGGIKGLKLWNAYSELAKPFARALDTATAGGASEWAPTGYSAELMSDVRNKLAFAAAGDWSPMPQNPWQYPILTAEMTSYLVGEATSDAQAATYTASDVTSAGALLTAYKHGVLCWLSKEMDADSIFPVIPRLNDSAAYAIAFGWDKLYMSGQRTAAIDTGDAPGTSDVRYGGDGIRRAAKLTGKQVDFGGSLTVEFLAAMIGALGKYADRCVFGTGYSGLARALVLKDSSGSAVLLTDEKAGGNATMRTGTVGIVLGRPLVIGGAFPENLNAGGIIDGVVTTKTGFVCWNPSMILGGVRQSVQIEVNDNPGWMADQRALKASARIAQKYAITPSATVKFASEGVNIPAY